MRLGRSGFIRLNFCHKNACLAGLGLAARRDNSSDPKIFSFGDVVRVQKKPQPLLQLRLGPISVGKFRQEVARSVRNLFQSIRLLGVEVPGRRSEPSNEFAQGALARHIAGQSAPERLLEVTGHDRFSKTD